MKTIKIIIFLFLSLPILSANRVDYKSFKIIHGNDGHHYMIKEKEMNGHLSVFENENKLQMIKVNAQVGKGKIIEFNNQKLNPNFLFIVYHVGDSGTSTIIREYRAVIYNTETFKFEADLPYKDVLMEGLTPQKELFYRYTFKNNEIKVFEDEVLIKTVKIKGP